MEYAVYPVAFDRARAYVDKNDLPDVIELFKNDNGYAPAKLFVNPKVIKNIGDGLNCEILEHSGVATWEVWCSTEKPLLNPPQTHHNAKKTVSKLKPDKIYTGNYETSDFYAGKGRHRKKGIISRTTDWRRRKELQGTLF